MISAPPTSRPAGRARRSCRSTTARWRNRWKREGPISVVVNIGGVSNITYIDGNDTLIACDTGPGNALLDDFMYRTMNQAFDTAGKFAALGQGRRSLDRKGAGAAVLRTAAAEIARPQRLRRAEARRCALADGAATLTAFTAAAISRIIPLLPLEAREAWIVLPAAAPATSP